MVEESHCFGARTILDMTFMYIEAEKIWMAGNTHKKKSDWFSVFYWLKGMSEKYKKTFKG